MIGAIGAIVKDALADITGEKIASAINGVEMIRPSGEIGKSLFQSRTIWGGILLGIAPFVPGWIGMAESEYAQIIQGVEMSIGGLMLWIGRRNAKTPIGNAG